MKIFFPHPFSSRRWVHSIFAVALLFGSAEDVAAQTAPLTRYNVDASQTSVSGLSSGGYMAVQFEVAFSSLVRDNRGRPLLLRPGQSD